MTDRIKALTVVLEDNIRDDDAELIINAIRAIRRVIAVEKHIAEPDHFIVKQQVKFEIRSKIFDLYDQL